MVIPLGESEVRQALILLRREHEFDRLLNIEWPRLKLQIDQYGLTLDLDGQFVRSDQELQWRVSCEAQGQMRGYCFTLNHPDCSFLLRDVGGDINIMSARNLGQILFDKIYNQFRQTPPPGRGAHGLHQPA